MAFVSARRVFGGVRGRAGNALRRGRRVRRPTRPTGDRLRSDDSVWFFFYSFFYDSYLENPTSITHRHGRYNNIYTGNSNDLRVKRRAERNDGGPGREKKKKNRLIIYRDSVRPVGI